MTKKNVSQSRTAPKQAKNKAQRADHVGAAVAPKPVNAGIRRALEPGGLRFAELSDRDRSIAELHRLLTSIVGTAQRALVTLERCDELPAVDVTDAMAAMVGCTHWLGMDITGHMMRFAAASGVTYHDYDDFRQRRRVELGMADEVKS